MENLFLMVLTNLLVFGGQNKQRKLKIAAESGCMLLLKLQLVSCYTEEWNNKKIAVKTFQILENK